MNALTGENLLTLEGVEREIRARDRQIDDPLSKDMQVMAIRSARNYLGDKLIHTAKPHKVLDPEAGPLIAVRLDILTRKTLGGLQTDLDGRMLGEAGAPVPGLYAAGEAAGWAEGRTGKTLSASQRGRGPSSRFQGTDVQSLGRFSVRERFWRRSPARPTATSCRRIA